MHQVMFLHIPVYWRHTTDHNYISQKPYSSLNDFSFIDPWIEVTTKINLVKDLGRGALCSFTICLYHADEVNFPPKNVISLFWLS